MDSGCILETVVSEPASELAIKDEGVRDLRFHCVSASQFISSSLLVATQIVSHFPRSVRPL